MPKSREFLFFPSSPSNSDLEHLGWSLGIFISASTSCLLTVGTLWMMLGKHCQNGNITEEDSKAPPLTLPQILKSRVKKFANVISRSCLSHKICLVC